ncbi:MAG: UDP-2,3-diacylglucosamine diphosphatase [Alcaligenaceae bacterium]|nr:UDP-2,3-diacylglucosamine diphosphatase [Alcaligenaceae bacterium]
MNKLSLSGTVWVASDIHLGEETPKTARAFYRFLESACDQADALILCGDIFDAWIGDDHAQTDPPDWLAEALTQFRQTASRIPLWIGRGNRDFLMGPDLAELLGARLLPDRVVLSTAAGDMLLSHGDEYCTDDLAYQRFRRIVRTAWVQKAFLGLGLPTRRRIAAWARRRSKAGRAGKSMHIMDANPKAVIDALRKAGCDTAIHGHTHRPATQTLQTPGGPVTRIVLPDWDYEHEPARAGWLSLDAQGAHLIQDTRF